MKVKVHMRAFMDKGSVREVEVDDKDIFNTSIDTMLSLIFTCGQNDFQPKPMPSVSVGDVVELPAGDLYMVASMGFKKISHTDLENIPGHFVSSPEYFKYCYK